MVTLAETPQSSKEILLDNDSVLVVRAIYAPGAESGMHTHDYHHRVLYTVKGGQLQLIANDKTTPTQVINLSDGQTVYLPATTHNVVNIGESEVVIVETELKK